MCPNAVNFIAGCHAIYWYFDKEKEAGFWHCTKMLLKYHTGSISGSAFLHGLFYFADLLVDLFTVKMPLFSQNRPAMKNQSKSKMESWSSHHMS